MAYLLALMFTGVTVVRKGCGGGGDSTPAPTSSICLMPSLSTAALIALSIDRRSRRVTLSWWQNVWISTNLGPKNMAEKKWKDDFSVQDCTQEQNGSLYFFFHRSAIQKAVSVENDLEIQKFCDHGITWRHTSPLYSQLSSLQWCLLHE